MVEGYSDAFPSYCVLYSQIKDFVYWISKYF